MPYRMDRNEFIGYADRQSLEIRENYSGRGMYGGECPAIVGTLSDLLRFVADIAADSDEPYTTEDSDYLIDNVASDSMGHENVYYWPGLVLTDSDDEYDTED